MLVEVSLPREGRLNAKLNTAAAQSLQLCPTPCYPIDGSPPGSPIPGILQARVLEWVAIAFSELTLDLLFESTFLNISIIWDGEGMKDLNFTTYHFTEMLEHRQQLVFDYLKKTFQNFVYSANHSD